VGPKRQAITKRYDAWAYEPLTREYYGYSDFYNFGLWLEDTHDQKQACENLMEKLLSFIAEKKGTILDLGCGMGATTRHLLRYWKPSQTVGIDMSVKQLKTGSANAPGCAFVAMDAMELGFRDSVFDSVICVEAAFHFDRRRFLQDVYRVLQPGGHLVLSDILVASWAARLSPVVPSSSAVRDKGAYRTLFTQAGFKDVVVADATDATWRLFSRHLRRWTWRKLLAREAGLLWCVKAVLLHLAVSLGVRRYLLVSARKP
jgi:SAM-dependent methyltransferase